MVVELWSAIHPSTAASSEPNAELTISGSSLLLLSAAAAHSRSASLSYGQCVSKQLI